MTCSIVLLSIGSCDEVLGAGLHHISGVRNYVHQGFRLTSSRIVRRGPSTCEASNPKRDNLGHNNIHCRSLHAKGCTRCLAEYQWKPSGSVELRATPAVSSGTTQMSKAEDAFALPCPCLSCVVLGMFAPRADHQRTKQLH